MGKGNFSRDLDIFGASDEEQNMGNVDDMDIFGVSTSKNEQESTKDTSSDKGSDSKASDDDSDKESDTETQPDTDTGKQESEGESSDAEDKSADVADSEEKIEILDEDIEKLLKDAEDSAKRDGNSELATIVRDLQNKISERDEEIAMLTRRNQVSNEKLLEQTGANEEYKIYQPLIDKLDADPSLKILVKLSGNEDDKSKQKLENVLADMFQSITGIDISKELDNSRREKVSALSSKAQSGSDLKMDADSSKEKTAEEKTFDLW